MSRLPDMEGLAIFARIAELRAISATATDLGLSPPTVSKALARLEHRLGCRLFNRTSRRLVLTEAGEQLAQRAARLLADGEAAESALLEHSATPRGQVRLGAPMSFGIAQVAPILPDFLARYPLVSVDLHLNDARVDLIADGFDILLRIGVLDDSSLLVRRMAAIPVITVAAPAYLDRHGRPKHPAELADHACFGYAHQAAQTAWRFHGKTGDDVVVRPTGPLRANNGDAVIPAAIAGLGIARLPAFMAEDALADGRLEVILTGWSMPGSSLHLLTAPGKPQPVRVAVLAEFLAERLTQKTAA